MKKLKISVMSFQDLSHKFVGAFNLPLIEATNGDIEADVMLFRLVDFLFQFSSQAKLLFSFSNLRAL
jgi:hypothetical protein